MLNPEVDNTWADVVEGALGALAILGNLATPFLRGQRSHWGMTREDAERLHPGDEYVPEPGFQWTHAIDISAPPAAVWPWVAQLGQRKGGFYSYQFLENLVGSEIQNASSVHPEWQSVSVGDSMHLHRRSPPLTIASVETERWLIVRGGVDPSTSSDCPGATTKGPYVVVSWALLLEPRSAGRTRLVSRFRSRSSTDLGTRVLNGPYLTEAFGSAMDRRMLHGIKQRAEAFR